jgi:predicted nucleic-acid-binding Zn-ribbon protein
MSSSLTCPECNGDNLHRSVPVSSGNEGFNLLPGLGKFASNANFTTVVCTDCGYTRLFATSDALKQISDSDSWRRLF